MGGAVAVTWYALSCATCTVPVTFKLTRRCPCEKECVVNGALIKFIATVVFMAEGVLTVTVNEVPYVISRGKRLMVGFRYAKVALR